MDDIEKEWNRLALLFYAAVTPLILIMWFIVIYLGYELWRVIWG